MLEGQFGGPVSGSGQGLVSLTPSRLMLPWLEKPQNAPACKAPMHG